MTRIIEYSAGNYAVETQVVNAFSHQLHVKDDRVGIWNIGNDKYVNGQLEPFGDWIDPMGVPYPDLASLISDLNAFFFDIEFPYPEVNTYNDLPTTLGTPVIGEKYIVNNPVSSTILGIPYRTFQSGMYIRDTNAGALSDWRRLNVKVQYTTGELEVHDTIDTSKVFGFVASLLTGGVKRLLTIQDKSYTIGDHADSIGTVTVHSDVVSAGSQSIITAQERTDINAQIDVHSDVDYTGTTIANEFLLKRSGANWIPTLKAIVRSSALVINNTNVLQDKINQNIDVERLVPHKITVSYQWSLNDGAQDFLSECTFGGARIQNALTPQEIHRQEPKDTAGADPDGRGTNQMHAFTKSFFITPASLGNNALILQFAGSQNGDLASMWEAVIEVEELVSVIGS